MITAFYLFLSTFGLTTGLVSFYFVGNEKAEIFWFEKSFRQDCQEIVKSDKCLTPIYPMWRNAPLKLYAGMAPLYWVKSAPQIILFDKDFWSKLTYFHQKNLVYHEMGHAVLGWGHHSNSESLMFGGAIPYTDAKTAFIIANEIENSK